MFRIFIFVLFSVFFIGCSTKSSPNVTERALSEIVKVLDEGKVTLFEKYRLLLTQEPGLAGTVKVSFEVAPDGSVFDAIVLEENLNNSKLLNESLKYIESLRFQSGNFKSETVDYKITFAE